MEGKKEEKIYSYSRLTTFEQCRLKFKFRYIDKIIPKIEKSIEAHLGSAVHSVLERLYTQVKEGHVPSLDEVIVQYTEEWQREYSKDFITPGNLSHQDYFNKGVEFLITYYVEHKPFDDNTLETEKRILINLDEEGNYKLQGFIDRLSYNLKTKEYEIHDYKTANSPPSEEKLNKDRQLALYSIAIKNNYGLEKDVKLIWHFLAFNKRFHIKKTNAELDKLKAETIELIKKIEETKEFPANKSRLCDWCEYKSICPAWGGSLESLKNLQKPKNDLSKYPTLLKYIKEEKVDKKE
ncbi:MAG: PD-(D/E)XK nuclease family protein [Nanoarchaeota archaeon]